jgi:hypothetical protein
VWVRRIEGHDRELAARFDNEPLDRAQDAEDEPPHVDPRHDAPEAACRRFQRACERGDLFDAELAAKEFGYVSLPNAPGLACLYAAADSERFDPAAVSFLGRVIAERRDTTLGSVQLAAAALAELRTWRRDTAAEALRRVL